MNLLLLDPAELRADGTARLEGRRAAHVAAVLRASVGDRIQAGVVGGRMGGAEILALSPSELVLRPELDRDPPAPAPVSLLLALPRPKILRRVVQAAASMGVKRLVLLGSWRVEKSYWASPHLSPEGLRTELLLGLEQGRDTVLPEVLLRRFFKPFVEDELEAVFPEPIRLLAHPAGAPPLDALAVKARAAPAGSVGETPAARRAALAIGPEGGWTPFEAAELRRRAFAPFSLGPRVLRVDAAVPYAVGQVDLWVRGAGRRGPLE